MLKITSEEDGEIRQGTIAQFMRKRTQLVGFEFGYWKHSQYAAEFLDNALDAIEYFQWKELAKKDSKINFSLDQDLFLGNLTLVKEEREKSISGPLSNEAKRALMQEIGMEPRELAESEIQIVEKEEEKESEEIANKDQVEFEEEVKKITADMEELIKPVELVIDLEPMVIIRLSESEPPLVFNF